MITFIDTKGNQKEAEKCLDSQLWHACAGSMVQMPPVDSLVFYFPQGHAEHSREFVDFRKISKLPPYIPCRVSAIKFMADPVTDEVYAKIKLNPVRGGDSDDDSCNGVKMEGEEKPSSFAKTLTQSDANNGGGFSVPRYCAETIFPRLDYSADPPVQTILARDVQGETWKFRHIYRGTPRRHLLTTGWSAFVNHKKLVAGDSIVFLRTQSGELCVGIRRAKRVGGGGSGGSDPSPGWNPAAGGGSIPCGGFRPERPHGGGNGCLPPYGSFSMFLREGEMRNGSCNGGERLSSRGKMEADLVIEAMNLAARGEAFEVEYYPRASTPEFCIKASLVKAALQIRWCSGMRFKMPFETEDSSRISWFMGTISSVQVADPIRWPDSPWRLLQVTWDEPDLLQNVKHVSPWLVELVSTMPPLHLSPFSPPWKKPKHQHPEFPLQFPMPSFTGATHLMAPPNPHIPSFAGANHIMAPANGQIPSFAGATHMMAPENSQIPSFAGAAHQMAPANTPAGMQGARHARFGFPLPDFHFEKLHSALFATSFPQFDKPRKDIERENVSCLLTMGTSKSTPEPNKVENSKPTASQFVLFGQPILTEEQISSGNSSSESNTPKITACEELDTGSETGHCKVFMESDDVGRTLDLSVLGSYEELYHKLANMFGTESSEMTNHVISRDVTGSVKQIGDEPFGDFVKTAKRLTILMDSGSENVGV